MISVVIPIAKAGGIQRFRRILVGLEADRHLGLDILGITNDQDTFIEARNSISDSGVLLAYSEKEELLKAAEQYLNPNNKYVFLTNGNLVIPSKAITKMYRHFLNNRGVGFVSGVIDRPVVYWVDNILSNSDSPKYVYSSERNDLDDFAQIDTTGVYGMLTKYSLYKEYYCMQDLEKFRGYSFGVRLVRSGYQNYVDNTIHLKELE